MVPFIYYRISPRSEVIEKKKIFNEAGHHAIRMLVYENPAMHL